jgi:hypothetical protein
LAYTTIPRGVKNYVRIPSVTPRNPDSDDSHINAAGRVNCAVVRLPEESAMRHQSASRADDWPSLPAAAWDETRVTLHMWTQIIGKIRLAQAPMTNHWWQVPLYVTSRGLTTSPIP